MEHLIETENLSYEGILHYKDLRIPTDAATFVCGASGCGKSTLFRLMNGTVSPGSGRVLYRGGDIAELDKIQLRRKILLVNQTLFLFPGSIYDSFKAYHMFRESPCPDRSDISEFLRMCCMDLDLDTQCPTMSGGERQRVFLSIALSFRPEVLLLDEPTSALNTELSMEVMGNIIKFARQEQITPVIISHDMALQAAYAQNTVELRREG